MSSTNAAHAFASFATPTFPTLSLSERDRRWKRVRDLMSRQGLDALVVFGFGRDANDSYLTNEVQHGIVLFRPEGEPLVFVGDVPINRYDEAGARYERWTNEWRHGPTVANLAKAVAEYGLDRAKLGVVGLTSRAVGQWAGVIPHKVWATVLQQLPDAEFVDVSNDYETLTVFKSAEEQEMIRKAAAIGEAACAAFVDACGVGVPESVVTAAAVQAIIANGGWFRAPFILERAGASRFGWGQPEWFNMGGQPHILQKGDSIAAEIFAFYGGFESQQQIDVCIGEPDPLLRRLEEVCLESYEAGLKALRPGLRFAELAQIMDEPLLRAGCWNTGPMVQTVSPVIFNSATRINPGVDPALAHLPALPIGVGLDGDFEIQPGVAFAFEPNALRDGKRVCIGGTVLLGDNGIEDLNSIAKRLVVVPA
jgi:Xaa-Pro aminopeptidase